MIFKEPKNAMRSPHNGTARYWTCGTTAFAQESVPKIGHGLILYDWKNKWLKGEEYYHILTHADLYCSALSFKKYAPKTHPPSTYTAPLGTTPS